MSKKRLLLIVIFVMAAVFCSFMSGYSGGRRSIINKPWEWSKGWDKGYDTGWRVGWDKGFHDGRIIASIKQDSAITVISGDPVALKWYKEWAMELEK